MLYRNTPSNEVTGDGANRCVGRSRREARAIGISDAGIAHGPSVASIDATLNLSISQDAVAGNTEPRIDFVYSSQAEVISRYPSLSRHQGYKAGSILARTVAYLNDCLSKGEVPRKPKRPALISHLRVAQGVGVHPRTLSKCLAGTSVVADYQSVMKPIHPARPVNKIGMLENLSGAALEIAKDYPELLKHQFYEEKSTYRTIVDMLNDQIVSGSLERLRGGKISRAFIANRLGFTKSAMTHYLEIFHDYESAIGGVESEVEAKIPAFREWLLERLRQGTLEVWDGKINRQVEGDHFGIESLSAAASRYPRLGKLLDEIDATISVSGYRGPGVDEKLSQLRALLADRPVLLRDRLSVNRQALSAASGITINVLRRPPYSLEIDAAQASIREGYKRDPLVILVEGRLLEFHALVKAGWHQSYVVAIVKRFSQVFGNKNKITASHHLSALFELFTHIASSASSHCSNLFAGLGAGANVKPLESDFDRAGIEYSSEVSRRYLDSAHRRRRISLTNTVIRHLSADGLLPRLSIRLKAQDGLASAHIPTIAEAVEKNALAPGRPSVDDYLAFATTMLKQAAELRQIQLERGDQSAFSSLLKSELETEPYTAADNPASLILRVLNRRLDLIKEAAVRVVDGAISAWQKGQRLLQIGVDPGALFDELVNTSPRHRKYIGLLRSAFPDDGGEQGLANLIKVVAARHNYVYPVDKPGKGERTNFFRHRADDFGGTRTLQSYLTPSQQAVSAVLTLYLLESGSNAAVGRTLYYDCIEETEEPHQSKVTGYKARAQGKPIFAVMEDRCDALRAMRWLQDAVGRIPHLNAETKQHLFVAKSHGEAFKLIEDFSYRSHFQELVASIPELAKLRLSPRMLRPSILLKAALESDGRVGLSQAIGQHGQRVHEAYVNRYPTRFLRDAEVRHFQHSLETLVISEIENVHTFLGVDNDSLGERIEGLMKTGLGTFCRDRNGRPGNEGAVCKAMDCWNDCPQLIVIAEKREVAILQIWQHSLRQVEGEWVRDQPERWEMVWLPWLCFLDAVEIKMRQSFGPVWREAELISSAIIKNEDFLPRRPH